MPYQSDIEIAQSVTPAPIEEIAASLGVHTQKTVAITFIIGSAIAAIASCWRRCATRRCAFPARYC